VRPPGRFQVHELLRQYAAEKLREVPTVERETAALHAAYYAAFLHQQEQALKGDGQAEALAAVGLEIDNVRLAWRWAAAQTAAQTADGESAAAATGVLEASLESLFLFYTMRAWYQEGEEAFGQAAAAVARSQIPAARKDLLLGKLLARQGKCCEFTAHSDRAQALYEQSLAAIDCPGERGLPLQGLGYMAHIKGQYARAESYLQESLAVYREAGDRWGVANVLDRLCLVARRRGAFAGARDRIQSSLAIRREIGDRRGMASSLSNLGLIYCDLGDYAQAHSVLTEGLQICRRFGYRVESANVATGLCQAAFRLGEVSAAERYGQQSLDIYRDIGDYWGVAIAYNNLGRMAAELGDHVRAKHLYEEGIALYREIGIRSGLSNTLGNLGEACLKLGEHDAARQHLREALQIAHQIGATPTALKNLVELCPLLAHHGRAAESLQVLAFCLGQSAMARDTRTQAEALFSELSAGLAPEVAAEAEEMGRSLELDTAIAAVLSWTGPRPESGA
jgi:tetratricopeptide (TPR) repeat protein